MFPGVDGFHWTVGHVLFLSIFFAVVVTIIVTVIRAALRTAHELRTRPATELSWNSDFAEIPESERRCRHELAGRVHSRTCENAFDCRHCANYSNFEALPDSGAGHELGITYSPNRLYHRGHTWVEPDKDGCLTVGLDDLAEHIIGKPDSVEMPQVGAELDLNGTAWRMKKNGMEIPVRAPIEGTVAAVGGADAGWYLKIRPRLNPSDPLTLRHLLRGVEVNGWLARELERLHNQLQAPNAVPTLADGGVLVNGLMDAVPEANWDAVLADTFLSA